jgi:hypothetical protein
MDLAKLLVDLAVAPARVGLAAADIGLEVAGAAVGLARRSLGETAAPSARDAMVHLLGLDENIDRAN